MSKASSRNRRSARRSAGAVIKSGIGAVAGSAAVAGVLAAPALAGDVTSGDAFTVGVGGIHRFQVGWYDLDASAGMGRGYGFAAPVTELWVTGRARADNGITYGIEIEVEARGDSTSVADEAFAFIEADDWGRVELGEQDNAANRMMIQGHSALVADGGFFGGLGMSQFNGSFGNAAALTLADFYDIALSGGDAAKMIYFSPRIVGFQLGGSLTPDTGVLGRYTPGTTGSIDNLWAFGANYVGSIGDVGLIIATTYKYSDDTDGRAPANTANSNFSVWNAGVLATWGGWSFAAGYEDDNDTFVPASGAGSVAAGFDAGYHWNAGIGYRTGDWGLSAGYQYGQRNIGAGAQADVGVTVLGAQYAMAPGWSIACELGLWRVDNGPGTPNNDKRVLMVSNQFVF